MKDTIIPSSELIINDDGSVFHLHILPEDLAQNVIVCGDPGRVDMIASNFDSIELTKQSREFRTITGMYKGKRVTALSHGIGTDNIDIVMTELDALANIDFKTRREKEEHTTLKVLRIGTCGAIQPFVDLGSFILSEYAVGFDGLLNWYNDGENVMLKDMEDAFCKHMNWPQRLAKPYFVKSSSLLVDRLRSIAVPGITMSAPGFYGPQGRSVRMELTIPDLIGKLQSFDYEGHKVTNIEMESSALAGMSAVLGHEAATICLAVANRYAKDSNPDYKKSMAVLVKTALDAVIQ